MEGPSSKARVLRVCSVYLYSNCYEFAKLENSTCLDGRSFLESKSDKSMYRIFRFELLRVGRGWKLDLKGLFTNFKYITFFSCPNERNIFYERFISIKPLWLEIMEKNGAQSQFALYINNILTVLGRTDFEHIIFSIISSQSCFNEMDLLQKYFFCWGKKFYIFKIGELSL